MYIELTYMYLEHSPIICCLPLRPISICPESVSEGQFFFKTPKTGYNTKNSLDHISVGNWCLIFDRQS